MATVRAAIVVPFPAGRNRFGRTFLVSKDAAGMPFLGVFCQTHNAHFIG